MDLLARRVLGATVLALLAALAIAGVAVGQDREVIISDTLTPKRLVVDPGTVVTWRNQDRERHRVRSREGPVEFDSGNLERGERYSVTFVVPGEYPYLDERNDEDPAYFGTVVVRDDQPADGAPSSEASVTLIDESFQPPAVEVAVGGTVTWKNIDGDDDHTVTADDGTFNSGIMPAGTDFQVTFDSPGTFSYFCAIHPEMRGTVSVVGDPPAVEDDAADGPPPPAEPTVPEGGSDSASVTDGVETGAVEATIVDISFQPATIDVSAGSSVTWTNEDAVPHTVTARTDDFNSGVLGLGDSFTQAFDTPGTFEFFCAIHPSMTGTVVVSEPPP
jgi:plastocyanin